MCTVWDTVKQNKPKQEKTPEVAVKNVTHEDLRAMTEVGSALETLGLAPIPENSKRDAIHVAVFPAVAGERLFPGMHVGLVAGSQNEVTTKAEKLLGVVDPFVESTIFPGSTFWVLLYPRTITGLRHEWTHPAFPDIPKDRELDPLPELPAFDLEAEKAKILDEYKNGLTIDDVEIGDLYNLLHIDSRGSDVLEERLRAEIESDLRAEGYGIDVEAIKKQGVDEYFAAKVGKPEPTGNAVFDSAVDSIAAFAREIDEDYETVMVHARDHYYHGEYWTEGGRWEGQWTPDGFWDWFETVERATNPESFDEGPHRYFSRGGFFSCSC